MTLLHVLIFRLSCYSGAVMLVNMVPDVEVGVEYNELDVVISYCGVDPVDKHFRDSSHTLHQTVSSEV